MPRAKTALEVEIKLALRNAAEGRALLRRFEYSVHVPRVFEENLVLDDAAMSLFSSGRLLRVRRAGKIVTCTVKGPEGAARTKHKRREEHEFQASDFDACLAVFRTIGFNERFRYEKYRTEFARKNEPGHITLRDETPIGTFLELEGPPRWIDATARRLRLCSRSLHHGQLRHVVFHLVRRARNRTEGNALRALISASAAAPDCFAEPRLARESSGERARNPCMTCSERTPPCNAVRIPFP